MNLQFWKKIVFCGCLFAITACSDEETVNPSTPIEIPEQPAELAEKLAQYNSDIAAIQLMVDGKVEVVDYISDEQHNYTLKLSDGKIVNAALQTEVDTDIPLFAINAEGYWEYMLGGEKQTLTDLSGNPVPACKSLGKGTFTPQLALGEDGCWQMSLNGVHWKKLSDTPAPSLEGKTVASYSLFKSVTENEDGTLSLALSGGDMVLSIDAAVSSSAQAWKKFLMKSEDNVLLDYSYAGYNHGESAPADGFAWGYKVINVRERMVKDNLSARDALIKILDENKLVRVSSTSATNASAKIVIYFPAGNYDLQPEGNTAKFPEIYGGNFVIKGDGIGKICLLMNNPIGTSESTTAPLLTIKHTNSPTNVGNSKILAQVTENAAKGSFSVKVASAAALSVGKWVQLRLRSGNNELLKEEVGPMYNQMTTSWSIAQQPGLVGADLTKANEDGKGVNVMEFHQIKSIDGNMVTFYEPIMHEVNVAYNDYDGGWVIRDYKYFENVGVEDLTFVGKAITPYYHHGEGQDESKAWLYDSGYVPLQLNRVVNSWVRNVSFESVSEAITFGESANCSAYNISITGNRGHSAVRAQGSSRVFIGKVCDESSDSRGHGQWHGCGVSKPSMGTVVWNCNWGQDACFESHATQPRATLFDNCRGGLVRYHAGGAENEAPNHLSDLTLWNLYVTGTTDEKGDNFSSDFKWWDAGNIWWKIYPPIVVGTHGNAVTFSKEEGQLTYEESTGVEVTPTSLYEAQLQKRLGYVPAWLNALK
ncbi:DUF4955 domain-containing protein [Phocaeicola sp.]|uniref:DUF4955 domain-containing protein n=1 Tax=Phocaeicola sp. TaxID=2773926 RepID=UPI003A9551CE